jgi:uncharacterized membrane protein YuzA (DUF378 family)
MRCGPLTPTDCILSQRMTSNVTGRFFYWLGIAALSMNSQVCYLLIGIAVLEFVLEGLRFCSQLATEAHSPRPGVFPS